MSAKQLRLFIAAGIALAVVVVVLGAFTRLVDAGLGCPDWPGCYGHLTWPDDATEIEKAEALFPDTPVDHRYFSLVRRVGQGQGQRWRLFENG